MYSNIESFSATLLVKDSTIIPNIIPYGLVVRISGFHPEGSGSIPGMGESILN